MPIVPALSQPTIILVDEALSEAMNISLHNVRRDTIASTLEPSSAHNSTVPYSPTHPGQSHPEEHYDTSQHKQKAAMAHCLFAAEPNTALLTAIIVFSTFALAYVLKKLRDSFYLGRQASYNSPHLVDNFSSSSYGAQSVTSAC